MTNDTNEKESLDFIRHIVAEDCKSGKWGGEVVTRFPPEPNGYLHIGHAKAFGIDFGVAAEFGGRCHLRFDDTNPTKEEREYVDAIQEDIRWMGWDWGEHLYYASDYFGQMYEYAKELIRKGLAYVDDQTPEQIRRGRGTLKQPGVESPYRDRPAEESLDLFQRMKGGEFPDGSRVLRARIDMTSPNMNLRDPVMYRILHATHPHTGDAWCIYPMYDWAHGLEDSIEGVTHSLCSLEFENHRPLYDWFIDAINQGRTDDGSGEWGKTIRHPQQIEFARFNLTYTVMSKRVLRELVEGGHVSGWDDPRLPTLRGMRRRGYTPQALREFLSRVGVARFVSTVDLGLLEFCLRDHLNKVAPRVMGVLNPLKVVITNYPEDQEETLEAINNPEDESAGTRQVPFSRELYIEREDFMEDPPKKFFRLTVGKEVRLRYAYFITCTDVVKDDDGNVVELHCTYDPATRGGDAPDGRKVKGTLHWVSAKHAVPCETRLYDRLFTAEDPMDVPEGGSFTDNLNSESDKTVTAMVEPDVADKPAGWRCQFERNGYYITDPDSQLGKPVFNRIVTLRDSWAKIKKKG
ncbi:MAG: glutamine--tRNA ligase/YqeY domain fusion protein [Planctomycetes bacterium]|jgi:glutaminyl-tRNA synthetase|nr:glutamine--tRNA ligase/YqeY domain fusion protein [Phycisphaerae bacterium]NBB94614.1 glutamine--tRNA ligase/YqeY domain fusion protein [Planctomycetota bacterium]